MKVKFNRQQLLSAFIVAAGAVPSRVAKDVLRNVLLTVSKTGIELVATDQEIGVRVKVEGAETDSFGDALLPTQKVSAILREVTDEVLMFDIDDNSIVIKGANGKFRLSSEDPREYPPVPEFHESDYFQVAAPVFRQMVRRTEFATDTESTRYALGGVLLEVTDKITLAATDSRRLAVTTAAFTAVGTPKSTEKTTVVPIKALRMLERAGDHKAEFVDISVKDNSVVMRTGNVTVYSRLVEGRFPKYRDVIPKKGLHVVPFPVSPLFSAVRQSQIVTDEENRGVDFTFADSSLVIKSKAGGGDSSVEMPIEYDGDRITISFDPKYVADFLKVCAPESLVNLHLIDEDTAAVFRVDESYTYVVMPLASDR